MPGAGDKVKQIVEIPSALSASGKEDVEESGKFCMTIFLLVSHKTMKLTQVPMIAGDG